MAQSPSKRQRREAVQKAARRRQRIRWITITAITTLAISTFVIMSGSKGQIAAVAADFELETPEGEVVTLSEYRGRPVALTFMHTF